MRPDDLASVSRIGDVVHPAYPESDAVIAERLRLFPEGCRTAVRPDGTAVGYSVAHPGTLFAPPALDTALGGLPDRADCLYLHDVALLPAARGAGLGGRLLDDLAAIARGHGLAVLALTAVNRSEPYWRRHGFSRSQGESPALAAKLASYGADAAYLVKVLDRPG